MAITTFNFNVHNASQFKESLNESSNTAYYVFAAKSTAWTNESTPPTPDQSIDQTYLTVYDELLFGKRLKAQDVKYVIPRHAWTQGNTYIQYDTTLPTLANSANYVMNSGRQVYKLIDSNNGSTTNNEPTFVSNTITELADGLKWKYMYSISEAELLDYGTSDYIPVIVNTSVEAAAVDGTIDVIRVTDGGSGYDANFSANMTSVVNTTAFTIPASTGNTASGNVISAIIDSGAYVNSAVYITGGTGAGQLRIITDYSNYTVTVNEDWSVTPNTDSTFIISPQVLIQGGGTGAKAYSTVNATGNTIDTIVVTSEGTNYRSANVNIIANTNYGSGATAIPVLSPSGGHGSNAVSEFYASRLMLKSEFANNESDQIRTNNDYRIIGLIKSPKFNCTRLAFSVASNTENIAQGVVVTGQASNATGRVYTSNTTSATLYRIKGTFVSGEEVRDPTNIANGTIDTVATGIEITADSLSPNVFRTTTVLNIDATVSTGSFTEDETVRNSDGAVAKVLYSNTSYLEVYNVSNGAFAALNNITGLSSGETSTIQSVEFPDLVEGSGRVMFLEYKTATERTDGQTEDIKLIAKF